MPARTSTPLKSATSGMSDEENNNFTNLVSREFHMTAVRAQPRRSTEMPPGIHRGEPQTVNSTFDICPVPVILRFQVCACLRLGRISAPLNPGAHSQFAAKVELA